jgi:hypothetical protein
MASRDVQEFLNDRVEAWAESMRKGNVDELIGFKKSKSLDYTGHSMWLSFLCQFLESFPTPSTTKMPSHIHVFFCGEDGPIRSFERKAKQVSSLPLTSWRSLR